MEETLYSNGNYYIKSKKEDNAPHRNEVPATIIVAILTVILWWHIWSIGQAYYDATLDTPGALFRTCGGFVIVMMCAFVATIIIGSYRSAGTRITLYQKDMIHDQWDYQFTKDPIYDADKISKKVEYFKTRINERAKEEKKVVDESERAAREATMAYKDVMCRVKKNE